MVVLISVHLLTGHWLFHWCAPASWTEVSLLQDRACGTLCRLHYDRWPATLLSLDNRGLSWTVSAPDKVTAVLVRRNENLQTPISVPAVRPKRRHTLLNPAHRQDYTVACLNYTLQTMMPLPGWPAMAPKCVRQQQQPATDIWKHIYL